MRMAIALLSLLLWGFAFAAENALSPAENRAMMMASQRYPDLQKEGTPHYKAYQQLLEQSIKTKSLVFNDPEWPLLLAEKSRAGLIATQQGPRRIGRTKVEKYEDVIAKMLKSKDPTTRQYGTLEQAAHQADLAGDVARAAEIRAQLAELQALGRIEALLNQVNDDIWRLKQELRDQEMRQQQLRMQ